MNAARKRPAIRDTSKYQLMPDMSPAEFEALKADIAQRGVVVPIDIDETGEIIDGHHRYRAWAELHKNEPLRRLRRHSQRRGTSAQRSGVSIGT